MSRTLFVASIVLFSAMVLGCGSDSGGGTFATDPNGTPDATEAPLVSPAPRLTGLPPAATPVVRTEDLGQITRSANETPRAEELRTLIDASCADGQLTIHTSLETIYAALPCDRWSDQQFTDHFAGKDAAVVLEAGTQRFRILIQALDGSQAEFTTEGIWVE